MSRKLLLPLVLVFAAVPVWAQPANDECVGATPLALGVNAHGSGGATDSPEPVDPTGCNVLGAMSADVWYTYAVAGPDPVLLTVETCSTGFDTDLVAYDVPCPVTSADQIACDGDGCGGSFASIMSWTATPGITYTIRCGEWGGGGTGWTGEITVTETTIGGTGDILLLDWATNNSTAQLAVDCLGLTGVTQVVLDGASFDSALATTSFNTIIIDNPSNLISPTGQTAIVDHIAAGGHVIMSYWALDTADPALLAAFGVASETDITAYEPILAGTCCSGDPVWNAPNAIPGETIGVAAADAWFDDGGYMTASTGTPRGEFPGGQISVISDSTGGGCTFAISAGFDGLATTGARDFLANCIEECLVTGAGSCPLLNDTCATATTVIAGDTNFSSDGAQDEGNNPSCGFAPANDIWFSFTPVCDGDHVISTCGSAYDTTLAVHTDCLGTEVACNDDGCALQSTVTITASAGVEYLIQVSGFGGATGVGTLNIDASATAPANDDCANATALTAGVPEAYNSLCASNDGPLASCAAPTPNDPDVWFTYTATQDANVVLDTCGSAYDTALELYDDCPGVGTVLACNDDFCGLQSSVSIAMLMGETVTLRVFGFAGGAGAGVVNVTEVTPLDVSAFDVVLINGEGDVDGGLVNSEIAHTDALTAAGLSFIAIEPNLGTPIVGCPVEGWIYNNGTYPDDAPMDAALCTIIRDCVLTGNGAMVHGGDNWGFQGPTDYDQVDGIDEAATGDGGDDVIDIAGQAGSFMDGVASAYTQDQAGNDWTDQLALAAVAAGTEIMGDNQLVAGTSPNGTAVLGADYNVVVQYDHDEGVAPGAGDTISMSIEPAGFDDPAAFLASAYGHIFGGGPVGEIFSNGDCNNDGGFDIGDPVTALSVLFVLGTPAPDCLEACNANGDGGFDIGDPVSMLSSLFVAGAPPPTAPTFPACGSLAGGPVLGCATQPVTACP